MIMQRIITKDKLSKTRVHADGYIEWDPRLLGESPDYDPTDMAATLNGLSILISLIVICYLLFS